MTGLSRRHFLLGSGLTLAVACRPRRGAAPLAHPALAVQSGDVTGERATVWCKATRAASLVVEWGERFEHRIAGPRVDAASDLCGQVELAGLPAGAHVRYRAYFRDGSGRAGDAAEGSFATSPGDRRATTILWSGDLCGQGWGRNPDVGGYPIFDAMARMKPDLFVCSGDLVYADDPLLPEVKLRDGRVWRNQDWRAKERVAETLADFRACFAYNLGDAAMRRFLAHAPIAAQWDDHEVRNNWYPGGTTDGDPRYRRVQSESQLARHALRALREYVPFGAARMARGPLLDLFITDARSHKSANDPGDQPGASLLGAAQLDWLERELAASRARWKLIALRLPLGLVVRDGPAIEAVAQGAGGPPAGREQEIGRRRPRSAPSRRFTSCDNPPPWDGYLSFGHITATATHLAVSWHGGGGELLHQLDIPAA